MPTAGANKDYKFGQKNHWRRTIWNEILRRTDGLEKEFPILYLAGPEDLDRPVALSKGVPSENLIAIDRNRKNIQKIRDEHNLGLNEDAIDLLRSWPVERPISAVLLDFCGGFGKDSAECMRSLMTRPVFRGAVTMVNMLRGHDEFSNGFRESLLSFSKISDPKFQPLSKHRGRQLVLSAFLSIAGAVFTTLKRRLTRTEVNDLIAFLFLAVEPKFFSYRSGNLVFDSTILYTSHVLPTILAYAEGDFSAETIERIHRGNEKLEEIAKKRNIPEVRRRISATLAIRTQRINEVYEVSE